MIKAGYAVWQEGSLYYWGVHLDGGHYLGGGAATDLVRARTEAVAFGLDPARAEDIAFVQKPRREDALQKAQRAIADAYQRAAIANAEIAHWWARRGETSVLIERSKEAIAQTHRLLQAAARCGAA